MIAPMRPPQTCRTLFRLITQLTQHDSLLQIALMVNQSYIYIPAGHKRYGPHILQHDVTLLI